MELGWVRCEICGRRPFSDHISIGGVTLNVCIYCFTALSTYSESRARRSKLEPDEDVLKRFKSSSRMGKEVS